MFVKKFDRGDFLILPLNVDDMLIVRRDEANVNYGERILTQQLIEHELGYLTRSFLIHVYDMTMTTEW